MGRRRLFGDENGVVLIEFAIVMPFMILILFGGYMLANAMATSRKATSAVRAMADLTSQNPELTTKGLTDIMSIRASIVSPFRLNDTMTRISAVSTDAEGAGRVVWSHAARGSRLATSAPYDLPVQFRIPNMNYVVAEMDYVLENQTQIIPMKPIEMSERAIMLPRQSQDTKCIDCS